MVFKLYANKGCLVVVLRRYIMMTVYCNKTWLIF